MYVARKVSEPQETFNENQELKLFEQSGREPEKMSESPSQTRTTTGSNWAEQTRKFFQRKQMGHVKPNGLPEGII